MAQAVASNFRRRILGSRQDTTNDALPITLNSNNSYQSRPYIRIDKRSIEKVWKQMDRIVKYCQMPKMNLKNSPPYMLDILPDFYQILREIITNYEDRLHILNDIEYFRIFIDNLIDLCTKTIECFKRAGHHMYDEQSNYRKQFIKFSLYFSHNLTELKSLFKDGIFEGERFRLTKQEANEFWKSNFNERTIIPWKEFKEKLNSIHQIHSYNESIALQNTIDLTNNNHVSIFEFDVFTRLFHPWSSLLTNWKLLAITHPGFMAFMTYDEVKAILTNCTDKPGSYVFRLSCTRLGQWAIGYVTLQNTILQTIPQTKPLIQSLIDGEREGYYKYPNGKNLHIDLSSALRPTESDRIFVSEEEFSIYCNMGTSFELCKICSVNNKDSKIQPCGHLICQSCLISWQNQKNIKPPPLCPFCRGEIKGFESVIVNPFDNSTIENKKESSPNEFDDQKIDANPNVQNLQTLATTRPINNENNHNMNVLSDNQISSSPPPPPIPPRPVNMKLISNIPQRFQLHQFPPVNNNDILLLPSRSSSIKQRPLSLISSSDSLSDSFNQLSSASGDIRSTSSQNGINNHVNSEYESINLSSSDQFRTIDDIRNRLILENNIDQIRIEAVLILTQGLSLSRQYEMSKLFLNQVKHEQEKLSDHSNERNFSFHFCIATCVAAVFSDIEPEPQLKDIEKFMRDHGCQQDVEGGTNELEDKVKSIINELRNVLKETIAEGEMEMFLNSVMSLILLVPEDKINRPIASFSEAIVNANLPEKYGPMKLRVLTNLIYVVPERSNTDKYRILIDLIKCARNHRCINAVSVGINQVKKWVKDWKVSTEQVQELYQSMHEAYAATGDSANALQLLLELLGTYTKETASKARTDAIKCIINSINDPNVFVMDHLLLLEPVKVLEGENIHNLLNIFVSGRLQDYLEFYNKQKAFIESSGIKHDRNVTKMRLLTFLQSAENQKEVTFDTIEKEMQISTDDIESFIIEAVRTKMIRCKIDHLARKVIIDSTVQRTFTKQHWQSLKEKLEIWKTNLLIINNNLKTIVATAK
ncbi:unnamed protein product [Adineta steineri]|uniref:Eukaryotic translation initiation factor 3 subunit M n=1 Tax=Adineta steineri TaxID=433720 RepID=A0A815HZ16_9BILA|nr:unnamed protein product [Adineta steineri]